MPSTAAASRPVTGGGAPSSGDAVSADAGGASADAGGASTDAGGASTDAASREGWEASPGGTSGTLPRPPDAGAAPRAADAPLPMHSKLRQIQGFPRCSVPGRHAGSGWTGDQRFRAPDRAGPSPAEGPGARIPGGYPGSFNPLALETTG